MAIFVCLYSVTLSRSKHLIGSRAPFIINKLLVLSHQYRHVTKCYLRMGPSLSFTKFRKFCMSFRVSICQFGCSGAVAKVPSNKFLFSFLEIITRSAYPSNASQALSFCCIQVIRQRSVQLLHKSMMITNPKSRFLFVCPCQSSHLSTKSGFNSLFSVEVNKLSCLIFRNNKSVYF